MNLILIGKIYLQREKVLRNMTTVPIFSKIASFNVTHLIDKGDKLLSCTRLHQERVLNYLINIKINY